MNPISKLSPVLLYERRVLHPFSLTFIDDLFLMIGEPLGFERGILLGTVDLARAGMTDEFGLIGIDHAVKVPDCISVHGIPRVNGSSIGCFSFLASRSLGCVRACNYRSACY